MMKYAVIVEYTSGEKTGATVEACCMGAAWKRVFEMFDCDNVRSVQIAEILLPKRGG